MSMLEWAFLLILLALFIQSLALLIGIWQLRRGVSELDRNLDSMSSKLSQAVERLSGIADRLAQATGTLPGWEKSLRQASRRAMEAVRSGDQALARLIDRLQQRTHLINQQLDQGLKSFTHYSFQVHQSILHPTHKISDALQAMTAFARRYFSRSRSSLPPEFVAEEEEFI